LDASSGFRRLGGEETGVELKKVGGVGIRPMREPGDPTDKLEGIVKSIDYSLTLNLARYGYP
jgi:hypothetical protein